jgi:hypothetical protein
MSSHRSQAFNLVQSRASGTPVTVARFVCSQCGAHAEHKVKSNNRLVPEFITSWARDLGWDTKIDQKSARCPDCVRRRRERVNDTEAQLRAWTAKQTAKQEATVPDPVPMPIPTDRRPSAHQRQLIRTKLDGHFDDAKGRYLEGYSDQQIADELKVPRVFVEQIREAAYGPVRVSPEVEALERDLKATMERLAKFDAELAELRRTCATLEARMKACL